MMTIEQQALALELAEALEGLVAVTQSLMRQSQFSNHITAPVNGKRYSSERCLADAAAALAKHGLAIRSEA